MVWTNKNLAPRFSFFSFAALMKSKAPAGFRKYEVRGAWRSALVTGLMFANSALFLNFVQVGAQINQRPVDTLALGAHVRKANETFQGDHALGIL